MKVLPGGGSGAAPVKQKNKYRKSSIKPSLSNKPPPLSNKPPLLFKGGKLISPPSLLSRPPPLPPAILILHKKLTINVN